MKEEAEQTPQASIKISYDGKQLFIMKENLNNVVALGVLELAKNIMMKEIVGATRQMQAGRAVAADVSFRPPKVS